MIDDSLSVLRDTFLAPNFIGGAAYRNFENKWTEYEDLIRPSTINDQTKEYVIEKAKGIYRFLYVNN